MRQVSSGTSELGIRRAEAADLIIEDCDVTREALLQQLT